MEITSGIILLLWGTQYELWHQYQTAQYSAETCPTNRIYDLRQECLIRIRVLHEKRDHCLAQHRDIYFYPQVEEFLTTASGTQMKAYLQHYKPVIQQSIHKAQKITSCLLHDFTGFVIKRRNSGIRPPSTITTTDGSGINPHKHTRWKVSRMTNTLRHYFIKANTNSPDPI